MSEQADPIPTEGETSPASWGPFEPLRERGFRLIWLASLLSNFGFLILGVGAAWEMTRLNVPVSMVALVQTAITLPLMLIAVPAGAIADMFDRRKVAMTGLGFAMLSAAVLTMLTLVGLATPWVLLGFCSLIGAGVALYGPAWQASVIELVRPDRLPAAVALNSVSYNLARTVGPALGGLVVMVAGAYAAFGINALFYLPLLGAFLAWKRKHISPRLPPEQLHRAIISGARYAIHSTPIRNVVVRAFVVGVLGASTMALAPLVAKHLLDGGASTYGLLLGATGVGATLGSLSLDRLRSVLSAEQALRLCPIVTGLPIIGVGFSHSLALTWTLLLISGAGYMLMIALLNVGVQLSAPRWVTARALAWYQSAITGGIALGAWLWGLAAGEWGLGMAFLLSGVLLVFSALLGFLLPVPDGSLSDVEVVQLRNELDVSMPLTARSGPVVIEIDYRVDPDNARAFYAVMLKVQRARMRNGGHDWSISRDIADPSLWTERYHFLTWGDYIRQRARFTQADHDLQAEASAFHQGESLIVRRRLERPFGSVRWRADSPDSGTPVELLTP